MLRAFNVILHLVWELLCNRRKAKQYAQMPVPQRWNESLLILQKLVKNLMTHTGARVIYHGLENIPEDRNVFFVTNHQSYFDIPVLLAHLPRPAPFLSKVENDRIPMIRSWMKELHRR